MTISRRALFGKLDLKRFALVADAIPLDLLRKWDAEGESPR
ncbi:hypothetical protein [Variovorax sp. GB1P17]